MGKSWRALALFVGAVLVITGCQENLAGGAACPSLCPDTLTIKDTVLVASEALDTEMMLVGVPPLGTSDTLLLSKFSQGGQPIHTVIVQRFDSLVRVLADADTAKPPHPITRVDSANLTFSIIAPPTGQDSIRIPGDSVTFLVFDVDTNATDFDTAAVHARFSGTPIASRTIARDSITGTIKIRLDSGFVAQHVRAGTRIRLGIDLVSSKDARIQIASVNSQVFGHPFLNYTAYDSVTTTGSSVQNKANTKSLVGPTLNALANYELVLQGTPPPPPEVLATGGVPSNRIFLRFNLPPALLDSTTHIVRANLQLHQLGNPAFTSSDTMKLVTRVVRASTQITDIVKASFISVDPGTLGLGSTIPPLAIAPTAVQPDTIPLVLLFNLWKTETTIKTQHAILLVSSSEGFDPRQYYFYSSAAADSTLRPRLRISYIPKSGFGLP